MAVDYHLWAIAFLPWASLKDRHCLEDCCVQPMTSFWGLGGETEITDPGDIFTITTVAPQHLQSKTDPEIS